MRRRYLNEEKFNENRFGEGNLEASNGGGFGGRVRFGVRGG
jgi:hypothetical protein